MLAEVGPAAGLGNAAGLTTAGVRVGSNSTITLRRSARMQSTGTVALRGDPSSERSGRALWHPWRALISATI
jgi:hypothetical protein